MAQMKQLARDRDLTGWSKLKKADLIDYLQIAIDAEPIFPDQMDGDDCDTYYVSRPHLRDLTKDQLKIVAKAFFDVVPSWTKDELVTRLQGKRWKRLMWPELTNDPLVRVQTKNRCRRRCKSRSASRPREDPLKRQKSHLGFFEEKPSMEEMKDMARERGLKGWSKMRKDQLYEFLLYHWGSFE